MQTRENKGLFTDGNFKSYLNGGKFSKRLKNAVGKVEIAHCFFSHSVLKISVQQTRKNKGLLGIGFHKFNLLPVFNEDGKESFRKQFEISF